MEQNYAEQYSITVRGGENKIQNSNQDSQNISVIAK